MPFIAVYSDTSDGPVNTSTTQHCDDNPNESSSGHRNLRKLIRWPVHPFGEKERVICTKIPDGPDRITRFWQFCERCRCPKWPISSQWHCPLWSNKVPLNWIAGILFNSARCTLYQTVQLLCEIFFFRHGYWVKDTPGGRFKWWRILTRGNSIRSCRAAIACYTWCSPLAAAA